MPIHVWGAGPHPQADPPNFQLIPPDDIVGVTVILLTCSYKSQVRCPTSGGALRMQLGGGLLAAARWPGARMAGVGGRKGPSGPLQAR